MTADGRSCGACSLCCTVLRVDELSKLGGTACVHQRVVGGGCSIHPTRPGICRTYRCLWLQGGLADSDRPDALGAVLDLVSAGATPRLEIREAEPGAFDRSERLREIAAAHRESMPVRVTNVADVMNPDAPYRVLLAEGVEHVITGERIDVLRNGRRVGSRRMPWLERWVRRVRVALLRRRLRHYRGAG